MDLVNKQLSSELAVDVKVENAALVLTLGYTGAQASAALSVTLSAEAFIKKLEAAIPGTLDDVVLEALLAAIKKA